MKYVLGLGALVFFVGCSALSKHMNRSIEDFNHMQQLPIRSLQDAMARFPRNQAELESRKCAALGQAKALQEQLLAVPADRRSFANTMVPLDLGMSVLNECHDQGQLMGMVYPDAAMRTAGDAVSLAMIGAQDELFASNKLVYQAVCAYTEGAFKAEKLTSDQQYFVQEIMAAYKRRGLHLDDATQAKAQALKKEADALVKTFEANIAADNRFITASDDRLAGVDERFVATLKKDEAGGYILPCDYPTASEVSGHCTVEDTRKRFAEAFGNRGVPANLTVLSQLIAKRDQLAKTLGFESYAAYDIDECMAKTPTRAQQFLERLIEPATKKALREVEQLKQALPEGVALDAQGRFKPWDFGYVSTQYVKKHFKVDQREIAEYFPVEKALAGVFSIYQRFLGLRFNMVKPSWSWHDEVSAIEVFDAKTNELRGYIVLDLYPREGKYTHACCAGLEYPAAQQGAPGSYKPALCAVIANFPRPTADKPALFKHGDVETFFHEFGHAMHFVLGRTTLHSQAGYNTKIDFVEMPSQIFEEWLYDRDLLKSLSSHYKTGQQLPDHLIDALIVLKKFDSGCSTASQLRLALMSLAYYAPGEEKDLDAIRLALAERLNPYIAPNPNVHMQANFGHLGSYASRYYGYLWSKVFALDVFYQLRPHGLVNAENGARFVEGILGRGGSVDPNDLLRNYLGREPRVDAFFQDLGL
ncbi:hypothetical protein EBZ39_05405 [bacterium]|nr:hypothetical protein [bacterium]